MDEKQKESGTNHEKRRAVLSFSLLYKLRKTNTILAIGYSRPVGGAMLARGCAISANEQGGSRKGALRLELSLDLNPGRGKSCTVCLLLHFKKK